MIELVGGAIGGIFGGLFRLAPEVLKYFDKKDERKHELSMFDRQCDLEKVRGQIRMDEIGAMHSAQVDLKTLDAYGAAIKQQSDMAKAAGGWAASLSASVRPVVTYLLVGIYLMLQVVMAGEIIARGGSMGDVARWVMTPDFVALVSGVIAYWFVNRSLEKRGL